MVPEILWRVIYGNRDPEPWQKSLTKIRPAILEGYSRHRVQSADYPAVRKCPGATVRGSICTGLTEGDMWRLDIFEGSEYIKEKVRAKILIDNVTIDTTIPDDKIDEYIVDEIEAEVYVWKNGKENLIEQPWDFTEFRANKMRMWTGESLLPGEKEVDSGFADVEWHAAQVEQSMGPRGKQLLGNGHVDA